VACQVVEDEREGALTTCDTVEGGGAYVRVVGNGGARVPRAVAFSGSGNGGGKIYGESNGPTTGGRRGQNRLVGEFGVATGIRTAAAEGVSHNQMRGGKNVQPCASEHAKGHPPEISSKDSGPVILQISHYLPQIARCDSCNRRGVFGVEPVHGDSGLL